MEAFCDIFFNFLQKGRARLSHLFSPLNVHLKYCIFFCLFQLVLAVQSFEINLQKLISLIITDPGGIESDKR